MSGNILTYLVEPRQQIPIERQRFSNRELLSLILPILVEHVNQLNNVFIFVFGAVASCYWLLTSLSKFPAS